MNANPPHNRIHLWDIFLWFLLFFLIAGSAYYIYSTRPCAQPVTYSIGTFDAKFGISEQDFLADAAEAANLWNQAEGRTLLTYSSTGTVPINLIFDSRQQDTNIGKTIEQQENSLSVQKTQIEALQVKYNELQQTFEANKAAHADVNTLNAEVDTLNALGEQINTQSAALNAMIDQVNASAENFNTQTGADFNEGEYLDTYGTQKINIYEFTSHTQLVRVLAHEMGHALGLGHNTNPDSVMYPVNSATTIALTTDDKAALATECTFTLSSLSHYRLLLPTHL